MYKTYLILRQVEADQSEWTAQVPKEEQSEAIKPNDQTDQNQFEHPLDDLCSIFFD